MALGEVNGNAVILSGGTDKIIHVRDAEPGATLHKLTGELDEISALAVIDVDGTLVAVSLDGGSNVLRLWDLAAGRQLDGSPLAEDVGNGLAVGFLDEVRAAVTSDLRVWDLRTRSLIREIEDGDDMTGDAVAISSLGSRPLAVSVVFPETGEGESDDGLQVRDLHIGRPLGSYLVTDYGSDALVVTSIGDRMVLLAEQLDEVRLWSLGPPFPDQPYAGDGLSVLTGGGPGPWAPASQGLAHEVPQAAGGVLQDRGEERAVIENRGTIARVHGNYSCHVRGHPRGDRCDTRAGWLPRPGPTPPRGHRPGANPSGSPHCSPTMLPN